jgi:hypothetical protein
MLGEGLLVKKYVGGGTYFKFAQSMIHFDYLRHVFDLFISEVNMRAPSLGYLLSEK